MVLPPNDWKQPVGEAAGLLGQALGQLGANFAPDLHFKPCEFEALIRVVPDAARESHDQLYIAMDISLKVHAGISDHENMRICSTLKHEKLSAEAETSIRNAYAMGKVRMAASEFEIVTRVVKNRNASECTESSGFVLWQMKQKWAFCGNSFQVWGDGYEPYQNKNG
ncbi:BTB/POZ domain-containing protein NPY5-like isoform X1 [Arachis ipaensis]|uniref:BTB/POZ domain-containing protein NPY5-like isoform X1 n=1 Tax=Arachis ipaensis TaxID=130454 RepID=UPI000A2B5702|nr:BTB/POZ domain-containing protein NPY5-like isoform X1 [Arachis ipaensis]XP_025628993.1 BTB/POZ domain-containing protein NPY5 isoform X1 [Arachis hypogaea]